MYLLFLCPLAKGGEGTLGEEGRGPGARCCTLPRWWGSWTPAAWPPCLASAGSGAGAWSLAGSGKGMGSGGTRQEGRKCTKGRSGVSLSLVRFFSSCLCLQWTLHSTRGVFIKQHILWGPVRVGGGPSRQTWAGQLLPSVSRGELVLADGSICLLGAPSRSWQHIS